MKQRKVILYIAMSLDGYIATKEHNLDWLLTVEGEGDNGFSKFYDTVDTFLMGRTTYDWIMEHEEGNFPYKGKECIVFSRTRKGKNEFATFTDENPAQVLQTLQQRDGKNIWIIGGSKLLDVLMRENLIDEMIINIAPVLVGEGIPLFLNREIQTKLSLNKTTRYNQFIELCYTVKK